MLTGGREEDRDEDNRVRQWPQKDATLVSTGSGEEDRDYDDGDHHARRWQQEDATSTLTSQVAGTTTTMTMTIAQGVGGERMCSGGGRWDLMTMSPPPQR